MKKIFSKLNIVALAIIPILYSCESENEIDQEVSLQSLDGNNSIFSETQIFERFFSEEIFSCGDFQFNRARNITNGVRTGFFGRSNINFSDDGTFSVVARFRPDRIQSTGTWEVSGTEMTLTFNGTFRGRDTSLLTDTYQIEGSVNDSDNPVVRLTSNNNLIQFVVLCDIDFDSLPTVEEEEEEEILLPTTDRDTFATNFIGNWRVTSVEGSTSNSAIGNEIEVSALGTSFFRLRSLGDSTAPRPNPIIQGAGEIITPFLFPAEDNSAIANIINDTALYLVTSFSTNQAVFTLQRGTGISAFTLTRI